MRLVDLRLRVQHLEDAIPDHLLSNFPPHLVRGRLHESALRLHQGGPRTPAATPDLSMRSTRSRIAVQPGGLNSNRWTTCPGTGGWLRAEWVDSVVGIGRVFGDSTGSLR